MVVEVDLVSAVGLTLQIWEEGLKENVGILKGILGIIWWVER